MVGRGAGGLWGGSARTRSSAASACACWQAACPTRARSSSWPCRATPRSTPRVRMAALAAAAAEAALPRRPEWGSARRSGWCCRSAPVAASSALGQRPWELQQAAEVPSGGRCRSRWAAARPAAQRLAPARRGSAAACSRPAPRAGRRRRYRWPALCSFLRGGTRGRVDESAQRVQTRRAAGQRSRSRDVESRERPSFRVTLFGQLPHSCGQLFPLFRGEVCFASLLGPKQQPPRQCSGSRRHPYVCLASVSARTLAELRMQHDTLHMVVFISGFYEYDGAQDLEK